MSTAAADSIAGIIIPGTPLVRDITTAIREVEDDLLFDHSRRVFLFGVLQGRRRGLTPNLEQLYAGAMFSTNSAARPLERPHFMWSNCVSTGSHPLITQGSPVPPGIAVRVFDGREASPGAAPWNPSDPFEVEEPFRGFSGPVCRHEEPTRDHA
jgi:hypothetical protein